MHENVGDLIADGVYRSALHHYLANPTPAAFAGSPDFDEAYYADHNADVAEALACGALRSGYPHYLMHGQHEGRRPSAWFDPQVYLAHRRVRDDLKARPGLSPFAHYTLVGRRLGLAAAPPAHARTTSEPDAKAVFARLAHAWGSAAGALGIRFAATDTPDVSVVMPVFNKFDLTVQTLLHLSGSQGVSFEVILVDNASLDATRMIERHVQGLRVIRNTENRGFLHATNQGLAAARGSCVLLLNNDVILAPNALRLAAARLLADAGIGAVGGRVLRTHGRLQEAGCIVFNDGSTLGYGRDGDAHAPEYNFVRDVDFCSGVFLMLRRAVVAELGGLDPDFAPAYYEEVDLCARLWQAGLRVVYDPAIVIIHLEYGSSQNPDAPRALMRRNRDVLVAKHRDWLAGKSLPDVAMAVQARSCVRRRRVLFIDDTIPYRHTGSGFARAHAIIESLLALDCDVTVLPINPVPVEACDSRDGFDERVELLWDRCIDDVPALFAARTHLYDVIWVCRAHNLHRLAARVGGAWGPFNRAHVVLDTEALATNREAMKAALQRRPFDHAAGLSRELRFAHLARDIVGVSANEAVQLAEKVTARVHVLGHAMPVTPSPAGFAARRGLLALGSLYAQDTPNFDGLRWFIDEVWPLVRAALGPEATLRIAGFTAEGLDVADLLAADGVEHLGFVPDPTALYDSARVFVAPTRFAAGIPFKVHEAAAFGLPVVATSLLAEQLGWTEGTDLLAQDPQDPAAFAAAIVAVYQDSKLWGRLRQSALRRIEVECSPEAFTKTIEAIITP